MSSSRVLTYSEQEGSDVVVVAADGGALRAVGGSVGCHCEDVDVMMLEDN